MAFTKSEAGKGDDNRTTDWDAFYKNYDRIFKKESEPEKNVETESKSLQKTQESV